MIIELTFIATYFLFLLSLLYLVNNIQYYANHPVTERLVEKFTYNLRPLPRVNYKELSDEEVSDTSPSEEEEEEKNELRNRREKNPISRIIHEALN